MTPSDKPSAALPEVLSRLKDAHDRCEIFQLEDYLRAMLSSDPVAVYQARALLKGAVNGDAMLLEALDLLLASVSAADGLGARHAERWVTLALTGVLDYEGRDALNRASECLALRSHIAKTLGVDTKEVVTAGLVLSGEGAYAMQPSHAVNVTKLWRNAISNPVYAALTGSVQNHRILPCTGSTSLQVVHLVHVRMQEGDEPEQLAQELDDALNADSVFQYTFPHEKYAPTAASFRVWGCSLPWAAFQEELYLYETTFVIDLCAHFAAQRKLKLQNLRMDLALSSDEQGDVSLAMSIQDAAGLELHAREFGKLSEPAVMLAKVASMASRAGVAVTACTEVQYPQFDEMLAD